MVKRFKEITTPAVRENKLQAIVDFLVDNGMSEFDVNILIHTNVPALGGNTSIVDCTREDRWDDAWNFAQSYIEGDYF